MHSKTKLIQFKLICATKSTVVWHRDIPAELCIIFAGNYTPHSLFFVVLEIQFSISFVCVPEALCSENQFSIFATRPRPSAFED